MLLPVILCGGLQPPTEEYRVARRPFHGPTDIVGERFGQLVVEGYDGREPYKRRYTYFYSCRCDCGQLVRVVRSNLITGHTSSCGCLKSRKGSEHPSWTGHGGISGRLWSHIKAHARNRELPFRLTKAQVWELFEGQLGKCALTGLPLSLTTPKERGPNAESASLDRIDNDKGYVLGNVQWVHKDINWMKGRFSMARFLELCEAVTAHRRA